MTPKEKAEKLSYHYWALLESSIKNEQDRGKLAVNCAIIAVEEILKLNIVWFDEDFVNCRPEQTLEFWEEVLTELKKM